MARAAVLREVGSPLEIVEVDVASPGERQVRIRMAASGVCHSDLSVMNGTMASGMPIVLGHEGAGVVAELGPGVTGLAVGDHAVLSWVAQCGRCFFCERGEGHLCRSASVDPSPPRMTLDGRPVQQFTGLGTFATEIVVPTTAVVPIPADVPLAQAALIGCGVLTGTGAAMHTAHLRAGDAVAVVGCGGVGLNVIQGARLAGATTIIAVDLNPVKLELATQLGATHTINPADGDPIKGVRALTDGRGADVAFEVIGIQATVDQVQRMIRPGGRAVLVGIGGPEVKLDVPVATLIGSGRSVVGCLYGSSNVHADVPTLLGHYERGDLHLDELISRRIALDDVNEAMRLLGEGAVTRSVIEY